MANWKISYMICNKAHYVDNLTKAEAKKLWKAYMLDYGTNLNMSTHSNEGCLTRETKTKFETVMTKNGNWWFLNGEPVAEDQIMTRDYVDYLIEKI